MSDTVEDVDRLKVLEDKVDFIYEFCREANTFMAANTPGIVAAIAEIKPMLEKAKPMLQAMGLG